MAGEYGIPTTLDTVVLNTSLPDYQKTLVDNVYNSNVYLKLVKERGMKKLINGGLSVVETLIGAKQDDGGFYLGADILNNTQGHDLKTVEFKWQNAYEPIQITRDEERQNSGDVHKILDLVATKVKLSEKAIADRVEQGLVTSVAEANNLLPLSTLVNTGVCGTLNGGTDTFWQSTVTASGQFATQGLTDMTTAYYLTSSSANEDTPNLILTTKTIFQKFEQTRIPQERIQNLLTANAGFKGLTFKGELVTYANYVDSGVMYILNTAYHSLVVDSATDFITTPFVSPTNQMVKVAYILVRLAHTTNNRRREAKLTSIT